MKLKVTLKNNSAQGTQISDRLNNTGVQNNA